MSLFHTRLNQCPQRPEGRPRRGISVVEVSLVLVIGAVAVYWVPRVMANMEREKATDAFDFLNSVREAQVDFHAQAGHYAGNLSQLDLDRTAPIHFSIGPVDSTTDAWSLTLTRAGTATDNKYTVIFTEQGFDSRRSSVTGDLIPQELRPRNDISPDLLAGGWAGRPDLHGDSDR
ncbi:hypothetical protein [Crateriforma conspicua]|uniref:hypothetical protein n=1 Tax=Crateriforma conspicua TaxID=2527996 RepID=UPI001187CE51|nr:hypothetical protein [Crateriforma conspicua]QDV61606.1 hypothetical protein Mal65_07320 [Crateriforma conspicua]